VNIQYERNVKLSNEQTNAPMKEQAIRLELSISQLNIILAALQELPHRIADPIIKTIVSQVQPQVSGQEVAE